MQKITILGATGSIGDSTLDVIRHNRSAYEVFALSANNNVEKMLELCQEFKPRYVVLVNKEAALKLKTLIGSCTKVLSGLDALNDICSDECVDVVMSATLADWIS